MLTGIQAALADECPSSFNAVFFGNAAKGRNMVYSVLNTRCSYIDAYFTYFRRHNN